ncbi:hypothetical protein QNH46_17660 [Paenibacillus woosongensis]|uniref:Uncharacterized protein n=1 Tax=Paenibacillus woosongensis TaxID=307580 RepID=A0AA95I8W9_9BACL|nr:hypothetical protein [Paenibacillus woosongensis]WHX47945.1 hypothetical protein QNH46_17660 [Paenibacillus woosongensis]
MKKAQVLGLYQPRNLRFLLHGCPFEHIIDGQVKATQPLGLLWVGRVAGSAEILDLHFYNGEGLTLYPLTAYPTPF